METTEEAKWFFDCFKMTSLVRRELFLDPSQEGCFQYLHSHTVRYTMGKASVVLNGSISTIIKQGLPPWFVLHLDGNEGEMILCLNLNQISPHSLEKKYKPVVLHESGPSYEMLEVSFNHSEVRLFGFILKKYTPILWYEFLNKR